jgi:hypothetical protein
LQTRLSKTIIRSFQQYIVELLTICKKPLPMPQFKKKDKKFTKNKDFPSTVFFSGQAGFELG